MSKNNSTNTEIGRSFIAAAVILIILLWVIISLSGCKVGKKAVAKYKASSEFPTDCSAQFPPVFKEGKTIIDTVYGEEIDCEEIMRKYDEFWSGISAQTESEKKKLADSIAFLISKGKKIPSKKVDCPPSTNTLKRDTVTDKAAEEAAIRSLNELQQKYSADTAKRNQKDAQEKRQLAKVTKGRNWGWGVATVATAYIFRYQIAGLFSNGFTFLFGLLKRRRK